MKKTFLLLIITAALFSCSKSNETTSPKQNKQTLVFRAKSIDNDGAVDYSGEVKLTIKH